MDDIISRIECSDGSQIERLLKAVVARYGELYPDWELSVISLEKKKDRVAQIDRIIEVLQHMKENYVVD